MALNYLEIIERANQGEPVKKDDWDFNQIALGTRELVKKYKLAWSRDTVLPSDPDLIDRVFQAGLELISRTGIYSLSTGRIIKFSQDELQEGLYTAPQSLVLGEGKDARTLYARKVQDPRPPIIWAGNPGVPTPEELFLPMVMSWMQEPIVDLITCGSLTHVDGHEVRTGDPTEIVATRRELQYLREGLKRVGRPGIGMLAAQSSVSELGDLAVAHPDYLRRCDSHLVPMLNELIMENRNIARAVNSIEYGMHNASLACVMVGGLAGNAPGAAVVQVASFIAANLVCLADYHLLHPIHIRHVATSTREVMWVQSVVEQAFARNAPCIIVSDIYPKSGALTPELLFEVAANAVAIAVSGGHLEGVGSADGAVPNGSGLEARFMGEMGHAVTRQGLSLSDANALVLKLLEKYEPVFSKEGGNPGVQFDQAYDMKTLTPRPEWLKMYRQVKEEVCQMGLAGLR
ncbi:MAG: monomethylamine:corrinoid methyltransferase [Anaerolineaceae bacterium]|nr:monomethylamine:corrinoid methyltransferase [Anaerolineaceae bacterium]